LAVWKETLHFDRIDEPVAGLLFRFDSTSTSTLKKRFEEIVMNFVNEELGFCHELLTWDSERKRQALVFVAEQSNESAFIGGLVLVDPTECVTLMPHDKQFRGHFLGINRVWTHSSLRRKGLATYMLDYVRQQMVDGGVLKRSRIAFSEPTEDGISLAINYLGGKGNGSYITYALS